MNKIQTCLFLISFFFLNACNQKEAKLPAAENITSTAISDINPKDEIEGKYVADGCDISVIISKIKNDYQYILKTNTRVLKGKATYSKDSSGEKSIVLEFNGMNTKATSAMKRKTIPFRKKNWKFRLELALFM